MHPSELTSPRGNINPRLETETTGLVWLDRLQRHFDAQRLAQSRRCPSPGRWRARVRTISALFPMYALTIDGIEQAVKSLVGARAETAKAVLAAGSAGS